MRVKKSCNDSKIEFESEQGGEISALVEMRRFASVHIKENLLILFRDNAWCVGVPSVAQCCLGCPSRPAHNQPACIRPLVV